MLAVTFDSDLWLIALVPQISAATDSFSIFWCGQLLRNEEGFCQAVGLVLAGSVFISRSTSLSFQTVQNFRLDPNFIDVMCTPISPDSYLAAAHTHRKY